MRPDARPSMAKMVMPPHGGGSAGVSIRSPATIPRAAKNPGGELAPIAARPGPSAEGPSTAMRSVEEPAAIDPSAEDRRPSSDDAADDGFTRVTVFYGTDRAPAGAAASSVGAAQWRSGAIAAAVVTIALASLSCARPRSFWLKYLAAAGLATTLVFGCLGLWLRGTERRAEIDPGRYYGNHRGSLAFGSCDVSIPETHERGELESPSVFRLEFAEKPHRHVVLLDVEPLGRDGFLQACRGRVERSARREALVFVHGYNVTFEDAARRTAQLAYDLEFDGAPLFFSWPSQGGLLQYAVDETNAVWTVPHLKEFLLTVARQTGAEAVHLVAHSMGNRALTSALQQLSYELGEESSVFHEVVLTAPDIDAEVFRRDIAPAIVKTARRVTLYASSKDEALALSKRVHGYPRAGDSGRDLVVVPGIDTIDVSAVDTSLLGHSYYGDNHTVIADLATLLLERRPPPERPWLKAMDEGARRWWVLLREEIGRPPRGLWTR